MSEMIRIQEMKAKAYIFQPGDGTRYEAVVTKFGGDHVKVAIMNEEFSDVITILANGEYRSVRDELSGGHAWNGTNPWTVKAARELAKEFLKE